MTTDTVATLYCEHAVAACGEAYLKRLRSGRAVLGGIGLLDRGTRQKRRAPQLYYKGFPKFTSDTVCFFNTYPFPHLMIQISLLQL